MLIVLSPAKTLNTTSPVPELPVTLPRFIPQSAALIKLLRGQSPAELASLMGISDKLATLNAERYAAWSKTFTAENSRPAILTFNGDVYDGLAAAQLKPRDLQWAQDHIALLSGLYGVLRPLDLMQPYRLEMGTRLPNPKGANLYAYWGSRIAKALREQLQGHAHPVLINLASDEYFGAVDTKALGHEVVQPVFQDSEAGGHKVISFYAKRARGLMARYAITHRIVEPERLKAFNAEGYVYAPEASSPSHWVFRRPKPTAARL
ncbi:MAG: peroxide stress protein YaaA [Betaproteobacteria bacterium]|nr:peroxide stress protein YaaA [Betaproteobacteria bacterium]MDE2123269.1 peroxide stress protein YaaA [Betaproteobacteria bacterium]MDE2187758.1 peroxide stress protein YaaA [Betaproteobacteria bacterium]MDE2323476.1 peroxide stress protein YaaA [Betaproteobacteria bacterium]